MEFLLAGAMLVGLTFYALTGGADFGGGVWDLFATGQRKEQQRSLIGNAIAPVWEANHVWLILVIVILFTAFPAAFAIISTVLHIPLTLMLIGIVLRGSAFAFRTYDPGETRRRWGLVFSVASTITPILLGVVIGSIASGRIPATASNFYGGFIQHWLQPFPFAVGFLALALFAQLAAVYLTLETTDPALQNDFRMRAVIISIIVLFLAALCYWLSKSGARYLFTGLQTAPISIKIGAILLAAGNFAALLIRNFRLARICSAGETILILWGWALAQYPFLVVALTTIKDAAPKSTLQYVFWGLIIGGAILFPSFYYLFKIFKSNPEMINHEVRDEHKSKQ
jgi:cytochrome d ubiquinol oxidase subunit II